METNQLPKGWKEEELGEVGTFKRGPFGSSIKKSVCVQKRMGTYKLYEQGNVINNNFERGSYYLTQEKFNELKKFEIQTGDILITCAGTLGKIAIVPTKFEKGIINSVLMRIRLNSDKINCKYFIYFFKSSKIQNDISSKSSGVAIKNLFATKQLKKFQIPLPPLPLQQQIVSAIETEFARLDDAVKSLKAVKQKIGFYRKAVLKKAFEKKEGWEEKKLGEVIKTTSGGTPSRGKEEYYSGNIPWLKSGELKDNLRIEDSKEHITEEAINNSSAKIFAKDSVLIAMYGATTGKLGILNNPCSTNQAVCALLPNNKFQSKFIFYLLLNKRNYIINQGKGGAQPNISQTVLKNIKISFPSIPIQQQIVSSIESKFSVIDKVEEIINSSLDKAEQLKKSILKSAFEGRLVKP